MSAQIRSERRRRVRRRLRLRRNLSLLYPSKDNVHPLPNDKTLHLQGLSMLPNAQPLLLFNSNKIVPFNSDPALFLFSNALLLDINLASAPLSFPSGLCVCYATFHSPKVWKAGSVFVQIIVSCINNILEISLPPGCVPIMDCEIISKMSEDKSEEFFDMVV